MLRTKQSVTAVPKLAVQIGPDAEGQRLRIKPLTDIDGPPGDEP